LALCVQAINLTMHTQWHYSKKNEEWDIMKKMSENIYSGLSSWLSKSDGVENVIVYADMELAKKREQKRIDKIRSPLVHASDYTRKNSAAEMLGRSRSSGSIVECGRFLEVSLYAEMGFLGNGVGGGQKPEKEGKKQYDREKIAKRVNHRARKQIRRIVNANDFRGMLTLTIAPPSPENNKKYLTVPVEKQRDYREVRRLFKNFIERCRKAGYHFEYLSVFELHNSEKTSIEKRNTWHIHVATKAEGWIESAARIMWWHGIVDFQDFRYDKRGNLRSEEIQNPGAYIAEYIGKDGAQFGREDLCNKRRYTTSRGVKRPKRQTLESESIAGDFDSLEYKGKKYRNVYYNSNEIPLTDKMSITAIYQEEAEQEDVDKGVMVMI